MNQNVVEEARRLSHARTLAKALREITSDQELALILTEVRAPLAMSATQTARTRIATAAQEAPMTEETKETTEKKGAVKSGLARSAKAAKLGLTMTGVDRVGKGAMAIVKQPFEHGSKTREFLESDEGRHFVLGGLALLANIAAELESVPIEADNIEWVTEAQIANSAMHLSSSAADASFEKMLGAGMQLYQFVLGLKNPESMADIIEMTRAALETEDVILDAAEDEVEKAAEVNFSAVAKESA